MVVTWQRTYLVVGDAMVISLLFAWENFLGLHYSSVWNIVPACLMWFIWKERNIRIFEDVEKFADFFEIFASWDFVWVVSYLGFYTMYFCFWFRVTCFCFCLICLYLFLVQCVHHHKHGGLFLWKYLLPIKNKKSN